MSPSYISNYTSSKQIFRLMMSFMPYPLRVSRSFPAKIQKARYMLSNYRNHYIVKQFIPSPFSFVISSVIYISKHHVMRMLVFAKGKKKHPVKLLALENITS